MIKQLVAEYLAENDGLEAQKVAEKLISKFTFLEIVTELREVLTQPDPNVRLRGTRCLVDLVTSASKFGQFELRAFAIFFLDRLDDLESTQMAVNGLKLVLQKNNQRLPFLPQETEFWGCLEKIDMLNLGQSARYDVYGLLDVLVQSYASDDFAQTFARLCGGEKDPRNLMLNLNTAKRLLNSGATLSETSRSLIYDVTFCYFPIKFTPAKDDPHSITAEDLKQQLNDVLVCDQLASFTLGGLLSKLNAVNMTVKLEALATLDLVVKNLSRPLEFVDQLYDGLKPEILAGTPENATFKPCLAVLARLANQGKLIDRIDSDLSTNLETQHLYQMCNLVLGVSINEDIWMRLSSKAIKRAVEHPKLVEILAMAPFKTPDLDFVVEKLLARGDNLAMKQVLLNKQNGGQHAAEIVAKLEELEDYDSLSELAVNFPTEILTCFPKLLANMPASLPNLAKISKTESLNTKFIESVMNQCDFSANADLSFDILTAVYQSLESSGSTSNTVWKLVCDNLFNQTSEQANLPLLELSSKVLNVCARSAAEDPQLVEFIKGHQSQMYLTSSILVSSLNPINWEQLKRDIKQATFVDRVGGMRIIAIMANKYEFNCADELDLSNNDDLEMFAWVTKGLVMRNDSCGFKQAVQLAKLSAKSSNAAKVFGVIVAEDRLVSKENGLKSFKLSLQRVYTECMPLLMENWNFSLLAIAALIQYVPFKIYENDKQIEQITKLLVNSGLPRAQCSGLQLLNQTAPIYELTPQIIDLAQNCGFADGRKAAFELLQKYKSFNIRDSVPEILAVTLTGLGDKKRDVRQEAVKCRQLYIKKQ